MQRNSRDLDSVIAQTLDDINNLECQIRSILHSMDVVNNITDAQILALPEQEKRRDDEKPPETRMQWRSEKSKGQHKGKNVVESKVLPENRTRVTGDLDDMSDLDLLEISVNESTSKYIPLKDSVFFVPVLDRCVLGITLLNASGTKLKRPTISLSLIQSANQSQNKSKSRCFIYDVTICQKGIPLEQIDFEKTQQGLTGQDPFTNHLDTIDFVMPGSQLLVCATFAPPHQLLTASHAKSFSLLLSVYLMGKELWAREVPVFNTSFTAASIDDVFKKHHTSILDGLSTHHEMFKIERLLSQSEMSPHKAVQRFMEPLGYEKIHSMQTGLDTTLECYSSHQPSLLWGTCLKIEKCSTKASAIRCILTSRTKEQMLFLFTQLQVWLRKEGHKERKLGLKGIQMTPIYSKSNLTICERLKAEIDLLERLIQVKNILKKEKESGRTKRRKTGRLAENIDACWIHEYSTCVERTDLIFLKKVM